MELKLHDLILIKEAYFFRWTNNILPL